MEKSSIVKWGLLALAVFLFIQVGYPLLFGSKAADKQPLGLNDATASVERADEQSCEIEGQRFRAQLSSRGGSLRHFWLTDSKYARNGAPIDLVTTSREERSPLRTDLRLPSGDAQQVKYDDLDWKLEGQDPAKKSCSFTYADDTTKLTKTVKATENPFELSVEVKVENIGAEPKKHRLTIEQTAWRTKKETEGSLGLIAEGQSETVTATNQKVEHQHTDAFAPDDFKKPEFTEDKWRREPGTARYAATSSVYFSGVTIPVEGPQNPYAESQIEERWDVARYPEKTKDPGFGHVYRSRLAYPTIELKQGESATYKVLTFNGPKERDLLARIGAREVINFSTFTVPVIANLIVSYLYVLKGVVGSWGWAICLLTITLRLLLFPLSFSQMKNSAAMRRLKPEMDEINEKYKDDATQRGLATQELWRKNGVANPVLGCLPLLLQMPIWFAMYSAIQTAVELYHTPFGPLIPDLTAPGKYFIIPLVLGASSFLQQKVMPAQGDPAQQKLMLYLMPAVYTGMMFFLPAGLGVYMLTNTWLGIGQQLIAERYYKSKSSPPSGIEVREKVTGDGEKPAPALGKGKARVRG